MLIYHIVFPAVWEVFKNKDFYEADSLQSEGFIHCSFAGQLDTVLKRYYSDAKSVLILSVETEMLTSQLMEEASINKEIYPHIYGKINRDAIIAIDARTLC